MNPETRQHLGGARAAGEGEHVEPVVAPATGETVAEVREASLAQVDAAVAAARSAQAAWARTPPLERGRALLAIADAVEAALAEDGPTALARLEAVEGGKPLSQVRGETHHVVDPYRFYAGAMRTLTAPAPAEYVEDRTSFVRHEPVGVAALIAPWNYPLMMASWKLAPALAAGNAVVLKTAEPTPLATLALAEILAAHLPTGLVNVVTGRGETVGDALVRHEGVDLVSLTGDVATGRLVTANAAPTLKRLHLELGGKAPVVAFGDADLDAVVAAVRTAGYYNAGQDCTAACRVLVAASVHDELLERLTGAARSLVLGGPDDEGAEVGALITAAQRDRVAGFVERARALPHVELTAGGAAPDRPGFFYEPTVVAGARFGDEIVEREVFGPVVSVTRFDDGPDGEAEVLARANATRYGLAASVWTRDLGRALEAARTLQYGCVWVNEHLVWPTEMPHGGLKGSGVGKEMSSYGLEDYLEVKHVMLRIR